MCRIAGIIHQHQTSAQLLSNVKSMCKVMAHGGPDDEGFFFVENKGIAFGHRRLSLIDLSSGGHQPMVYQDKFTITFNGEIYNYLTLKDELLALGFIFHTKSDTEVILAGFAHWGTALFEKLAGMFAFALYDQIADITYLVRDHAGIKPLYYSALNQQLVFASEVKAFKSLFDQENKDWKIYFLAFGHIPEPYTTLQNVLMLPKAHYLKWDHSTCEAKLICFEDKNTSENITNEQQARNEVGKVLQKAVQRHLIADAPIGVFLSGGIDSSLLTLLANEIQSKAAQPLHTISINFADTKFSEKEYQDLILTKIQGQHSEYTLDEETFSNHFPTALTAMDQPTTDGINSWFVNYYAKKNGLKAVLSGIGADELFGGYPSFKRMKLIEQLGILPNFVLRQALKIRKQAFKRIYYLSYQNTVGKYLFLRGLFTPDEIGKLLDLPISAIDKVLKNLSIPSLPQKLKPEEEASWLETNLYMQNQLLKDTDFMSMQHGIEVRVPFLDKDLISLVHRINNPIKYKTTVPKGLLIDSFIDLLPRKIWDRPKMGFTFPFQNWLIHNTYFQNSLAKCKNKRGKEMIVAFNNGNLHWSKAMALYQIFNDEA